MLIDSMLLGIALLVLVIGSYTDIKTREVPYWVNFSLIFYALGLRFLYSSVTLNWNYLLEGVAGFLIFVGIAYSMFYAGQWGGGDSKMLMGLGAVIGLPFTLVAVLASAGFIWLMFS